MRGRKGSKVINRRMGIAEKDIKINTCKYETGWELLSLLFLRVF